MIGTIRLHFVDSAQHEGANLVKAPPAQLGTGATDDSDGDYNTASEDVQAAMMSQN